MSSVSQAIAIAVSTEQCPSCKVPAGTACTGTASSSGTHIARIRLSMNRKGA